VADSKAEGHRTPLSHAAGNGHEAVVKLLLKHQAVADSKDWEDRTPLLHAAGNRHKAVVKLLLEHQAVVKLLLESIN
jgi:ankyrin repeat protein